MSEHEVQRALLDDPDWRAAFEACDPPEIACQHVRGHAGDPGHACVLGLDQAPFGPEDVRRIIGARAGAPHKRPWLGVFALADGRVALVKAWCCGRGWTCHQGGKALVARDIEAIARHGLTGDEALRLGLLLG